MEKSDYFSDEALARFVSAQGKTVDKVLCHLWQNSIDKNNTVELIDNVELHFTDGQKLTIACNQNGDGLDAIAYDYAFTAAEVQKEFEGKIKVFSVNASTTTMWSEVIGKRLLGVRVVKEGDYHTAGSVVLDFGSERRLVAINPLDGLIIDYYEE